MKIVQDQHPHQSMRITDLKNMKPVKPEQKGIMLGNLWHNGIEYKKSELIEDKELIKVFKKLKIIS